MININSITGTSIILSEKYAATLILFSVLISSLMVVLHSFSSRRNHEKNNSGSGSGNGNRPSLLSSLSSLPSSSSAAAAVFINPCPNPDCVRCQKYKEIQLSAKRRLPHLIRHWKSKRAPDSTSAANYCSLGQSHADRTGTGMQRIIDGVHNSSKMNTIHYGCMKGQHPTVLFVPRLLVSSPLSTAGSSNNNRNNGSKNGNNRDKSDNSDKSNNSNGVLFPAIVTHLHRKACNSFLSSCYNIDSNNSYCTDGSAMISHNSTSTEAIVTVRNVMFQEYIDSQIHNAQWTANHTGTIASSSYTNKVKNEKNGKNMNMNMNMNMNGDNDSTTAITNNSKDDGEQLWEVLYLMNQGRWIDENIQKFCPKTFDFVSKLDGLMQNCLFGNIFFSVLYPGTIIEPHCGPTNIRHRLHFPLSVPPVSTRPSTSISSSSLSPSSPSCTSTSNNDDDDDHDEHGSIRPILRVLNTTMVWEEGEAFVFDDSLIHSAEYPNVANGSTEVRVVLVVDLWHPSLSDDERGLLASLYPPM